MSCYYRNKVGEAADVVLLTWRKGDDVLSIKVINNNCSKRRNIRFLISGKEGNMNKEAQSILQEF